MLYGDWLCGVINAFSRGTQCERCQNDSVESCEGKPVKHLLERGLLLRAHIPKRKKIEILWAIFLTEQIILKVQKIKKWRKIKIYGVYFVS